MKTLNPTPHTTIEFSTMDDEIHSGYVAYIRHNYGEYWFNGNLRTNIGEHTLYINSWNKYYSAKRAKEYWSMYF